MGRMQVGVLLAVLLSGCGGSSSSSSSTAAPTTSQTPNAPSFVTLEQGTTSGVSSETFLVADDATAWALTWNRHKPGAPIPTLDFPRERAVGVFLGDRPTGGHAVEVVSVAQVTSDTVEVGYVVTRPSGAATAQVTQPYHLVSITNAVGAIRFVEQTAPPTTFPLTDAHGSLVWAPTRAGGQTLAFLEDGVSQPRELVDPSAITAAGGYAGATLVVTGAAEANPTGLTSLPESLRVSTFALDTVRTTARVVNGVAGVELHDVEGNVHLPAGSLTARLSGLPDRPLRITGHADANQRLVLTSVRETATVAIRVAGGLAGLDERFSVDDLTHTGAARYTYSLVIQPLSAKRGRGAITATERTDLERLTAAADLHNQPSDFRPVGLVVADAPITTISFSDRAGEKTITIRAGATLPPALDALVQQLHALRQVLPAFRVLEAGSFSQITQEGTRIARTQAELDTLWRAHSGNTIGATPPTVDFTKEYVVAVFMGRKPSGGYGISVERLEQVLSDLRLTVERSSPAPGAAVTTVITSPFQLVAVEHKGAVDVYVDGQKP